MTAAFFTLVGGFLFLVGVFAILSAPFVIYFSRGLTFLQALRISAISWAAAMLIVVGFVAIEPFTGGTLSGVGSVIAFCVAGSLITRLAAKNGIKKTGRLGVGAKSALSLIALSWMLIGVMYLVGML